MKKIAPPLEKILGAPLAPAQNDPGLDGARCWQTPALPLICPFFLSVRPLVHGSHFRPPFDACRYWTILEGWPPGMRKIRHIPSRSTYPSPVDLPSGCRHRALFLSFRFVIFHLSFHQNQFHCWEQVLNSSPFPLYLNVVETCFAPIYFYSELKIQPVGFSRRPVCYNLLYLQWRDVTGLWNKVIFVHPPGSCK